MCRRRDIGLVDVKVMRLDGRAGSTTLCRLI